MKSSAASLNWPNAFVLVASPVLAIAGLALYVPQHGVHWADVLSFFVFYALTGLAVTAGYHRHFSHRAYDCHPVVQFLYLVFGAAAMQNSVLCWAADHRDHHRYVDKEQDPYNIKKGFLWAHIGWIFFDKPADEKRLEKVQDLMKLPLARWQHRYYVPLAVTVSFALPFLLGLCFDRPWGGLLWGGVLRMVVSHHSTFLINSAAHYFGDQPHSTANSARDSWWLAFLSFGEGYHNFHHAHPGDYRNGTAWYHWDVTKWLVRSLSMVGLAWNLRRVNR